MRYSPEFHNLLGFTREEILFNFKDQIKTIAERQNKTEDQLMLELEQHYNGYRYHVKAKDTLYNAFVIQNYFKSGGELENYFGKSGDTKILLRSLNQQAIPELRIYLDLFSNPNSRVKMPTDEITTPKAWETLQKDFKQNSFDAGYLTIAGTVGDQVELKVPNAMVFQNLQQLLQNFLIKNDSFGKIMMSLKQKKFKKFIEALEEVAFRDKTVLNLAAKDDVIQDDADYEVVLHQMLTMTFHLALEEEKKKTSKNYVLLNEKKVSEGTSNYLIHTFY